MASAKRAARGVHQREQPAQSRPSGGLQVRHAIALPRSRRTTRSARATSSGRWAISEHGAVRRRPARPPRLRAQRSPGRGRPSARRGSTGARRAGRRARARSGGAHPRTAGGRRRRRASRSRGQCRDEARRRPPAPPPRRIRASEAPAVAETDVVGNGAAQERRVLRHPGDAAPPGLRSGSRPGRPRLRVTRPASARAGAEAARRPCSCPRRSRRPVPRSRRARARGRGRRGRAPAGRDRRSDTRSSRTGASRGARRGPRTRPGRRRAARLEQVEDARRATARPSALAWNSAPSRRNGQVQLGCEDQHGQPGLSPSPPPTRRTPTVTATSATPSVAASSSTDPERKLTRSVPIVARR